MTGRTVWLASYPKSGNTWVRAIVTALSTHPHLFQVNQLSSGAQPFSVAGSLPRFGLDSRWLSFDENDRLRTALVRWQGGSDDDESDDGDGLPRLRKTHEMWRPGLEGREPFPADVTRSVVLVVRDPRDVACSYAPFFGVDLDDAIDAMGREAETGPGKPVQGLTAQPWGSWSEHLRSWLAPELPFPVHVVRYEGLLADPVATIEPVFAAIGLDCTRDELTAAVERARFDRLQEAEARDGFQEVSPNTRTFFREGRSGGWRDVLTEAQVATIEADHGDAMLELGYELMTREAPRRALAESRASRRRRGATSWMTLPAHLGLEVRVGTVPDELPDAVCPLPWLQTTSQATRVEFGEGNALLVENGRDVTVQWNHDPAEADADLGWLVQGWSVTLASLQRGNLSLHASSVQIGDEVVALAGHRGAGKSTSAMGLRARGHQLLVDDTTVIELRDDGAWTTPYARNVHLLPDAADAVGVNPDALPFLVGRHGKVAFRAEEPPAEPHRIDRIVVLTRPVGATGVSLTEVRGAARIRILRQHVSRLGLAPVILGEPVFFGLVARLADAATVQVMRRPPGDWTLDAVLDAIESCRPAVSPTAG